MTSHSSTLKQNMEELDYIDGLCQTIEHLTHLTQLSQQLASCCNSMKPLYGYPKTNHTYDLIDIMGHRFLFAEHHLARARKTFSETVEILSRPREIGSGKSSGEIENP